MKAGFGFSDHLLYLDRKAVGAVEAKPHGDADRCRGAICQICRRSAGQPAGTRPPLAFTAVNIAYRLLNHAGAKRILFLVDRGNLGNSRKFPTLHTVQRLKSNTINPAAKVVTSSS